jgi:predicted nicotinamide N-methyase
MLRLLDTRPAEALLPAAREPGVSPLRGRRVLDVSAGAGLCALGCAVAGARVVATDIEEQTAQLARNVDRGRAQFEAQGGSVHVAAMRWGDDPRGVVASASGAGAGTAEVSTPHCVDVAVVSDVLFIALRDGLTDALATCLRQLADVSRAVLFGYEERLIAEEEDFMQRLAAAVGVDVEEIKGVEARKEGV